METLTFTETKKVEGKRSKLFLICIFLMSIFSISNAISQPLSVANDPICSIHCCSPQFPCNCSAGVIASGGVPPYSYTVINGSSVISTNPCVTGLCPGSYNFIVRDASNAQVSLIITVGGACCKLNCRDTSFCYNVPDSAIHLVKPHYANISGGGGTGNGGPSDCVSDSIWSIAPGVYPVGTTVVKWYVIHNGILDSCSQNVIRNAPSVYSISFNTSPALVAGVINICNGQSITFNNTSTGTTGQLWNFGNGYYSSNASHTEPASHYPPGTYYDTLTVYDACGTPHDTAFTVIVDSASGPDIYCVSVVCPGDTVTYHTHANCTGYSWSVTGGTFLTIPTSTSDSATVIWGAGPNGFLTLNVSGCTPALTCPLGTTVKINIVPTTLPIAGDTIVCSGSKSCYSVECIPGNTHGWELLPSTAGVITGQGTCEVCIQWNPTFFGTVTLIVNYNNVLTGAGCNLPGNCSAKHGCGGTGTITIHVRPIFGISGPAKVCPNTVSAPFNGMNLTNNTIASGVSWKLVTPIPSTLTFANSGLLNAYTWNAGIGIYQLTAYAPANIYCNDSAVTTVEVVNIIAPNNIVGPDTVCANVPTVYSVAPNMTGVTYTWTIIGGGVIVGPATGNSVSISWPVGGGSVSVIQTLSALPGCISSSSSIKIVKTWPNFPLPVITASNPTVCLNSTITYSIPLPLISNGTYTWSIVPATAGNIISANGTNTITIKWISSAITPIFVKLKISRCYADSVMLPINLLPLPAVPNISYLPATPCLNSVVQFTTTSPGTWNWNFGDAGVSTIQNPPHTYVTPGDFNVQLYVTNLSGCSDTAYTQIHVNDIPVSPIIAGNDSVCLNSVNLYSFSQPLFMGASYTWSLSAPVLGSILSSGNNFANIKWTSPGIDTVLCHLQSTCLDTIVKFVVVVNALPVASISGPVSACLGSPVTFTGFGGVSYTWGFVSGSPSSSITSPQIVTYSSTGTFAVTLNVIDANGCTANTNTNITINPLPIAIITGTNGVCTFPSSATMTAVNLAGYSFAWSPSGNTPSITQTIFGPTTFSCIVTNGFGCTQLSNSITVIGGVCSSIPGPCVVNDSIDFTYTPPICLSQVFTKIYSAPLVSWNFGDGGTAGIVNPVPHTYAVPGVYPTTVIGTGFGIDQFGNPCTIVLANTHMITVPFDAHFDFSFQCNGLGQMQTIFANTSLWINAATSYNWNWYDITTSSTISNLPFPSPALLTAGTHVIRLTIFDPVTNANCVITRTILVPVPIVAAFTVSSPVCQGTAAIFTDNSINVINESSRLFNNGNAATSNQNPASLIYTGSGNFTASLTVTDIYGCNSSTSQNVFVNLVGTGTITVGPNSCDSVMLTASGPGPFTWSVINPPPFPTNPVYVKTSGFYKVSSFDGNGCPFTVGPIQVTVKQSPIVVITGKTQYCQGEALAIKTTTAGVSYAWNKLPSLVIIGTSANLGGILTSPGTFTYKVTVTSANGCSAFATYTITVDPVPSSAVINSSGPLTLCQGDSVMLFVNPTGNTYLWSKSPAPPLTGPQNTNPNLWVSQSGTYSVIVQTITGCAFPAIAPVTVIVNPLPLANIVGDTTLCEGETLQLLTTQGQGTYAWTGPTSSGITNPFVKPNMQLGDAGIYSVIVTNIFGCTATDTINVIINPAPTVPFIISNPGGVLCEGQLFNISIVGPLAPPVVYNWSTGQMGYSINAAMAGNYSVIATNQFGCTSASNVITIHPLPDLSCVPTGCYEFCNECVSVVIPGPFGLTSYAWQKLVGNVFVFYSATQNLTVLPPGGIFRLIGSNQWGCADSTDTLRVTFKDCCPLLPPPSCLDTCVNFNSNNLAGWHPNPIAPNVGLSVTNLNSQAGLTDYYILASDQAGPSQLEAGTQLLGKWCCGSFCYDYKVFDDGVAGVINTFPQFTIFNGLLGFRFTSTTVANETTAWQRICAPITNCNPPPISGAGTWIPIAGTILTDWTTVLNNVTEIDFKVDYSAAIGETSGFDNACISSGIPQINAGNDTTICSGQIITLHVTGCTGTPQWQEIVPFGVNFNIGNGGIVDVHPTQNTCYLVTCCGASACCCDTDTVCIIVRPLPVLKWTTIYPNLCSDSTITLNPNNIFVLVNNIFVSAPLAGGTGFFSGIGVAGNIFTPNGPGTYTICYTYTDAFGCTKTICNTIVVITCCDPTFNINAGPDQTVCLGNPAILNVTGCNGTPHWFQLTQEGPILVGQGQTIDVIPQQSTCYIVTCCISPTCCDTDTVCVIVRPLPILHWSNQYPSICDLTSFTLNPNDIQVLVNNVYVNAPLAGGTGFFSGIGVVGNIFTPNGPGTYTICYTYTDAFGCTKTICNTIVVITCCDPTFNINAGPDQTVCLGNPAILNVTGCNGTPHWFQLTQEGPILVGQGQTIDVIPQQSTCYIVTCCISPTCCDTDTVCVIVRPLPILHWSNQYPSICDLTAFTLNPNDIQVLVNNIYVNAPLAGGTGYFSGIGVAGNIFTPNGPGTYTICYTYTDAFGCTSTICNTFIVITCCDPTYHINAGPDQNICLGNAAILSVTGCNGNAQWFQLTQEGPILVGQGQTIDVIPQQSTCYIVTCCITPTCCYTDTVCVIVNSPPVLSWPGFLNDICANSGPITLNPNDIFVNINQTWVMSTFAGGTGVFSGPGVVGNIFTPGAAGSYTICFTYTTAIGCTNTICKTYNVITCCDPTYHINAGPDQNICLGNAAILSVTGCNGNAQWFQLTQEGPILVGQGQTIDVIPQQSTCYIVTCCITPTCCYTDTVCVTVHAAPHPVWQIGFLSICQNSAPFYLDVSNIFNVNTTPWTPILSGGGSGYFAGNDVVGNYFHPTTLGIHTIYYYYTDSNGCQGVATNTLNVISCGCGPCFNPGPELVQGGGFEGTSVSFISQLVSSCICNPGTYCISTNAINKCASNLSITSTSLPTGNNFMIVDGHAVAPKTIWQQNITILNTQNYVFSFWVHPAVSTVGNTQRPNLDVTVNANVILSLQGVSLTNGWTKYQAVISGITGSSLKINQTNFGATGNDYGIDDISLKQCIRSINITFNPTTNVSCAGFNDGSVTAVVSGGTTPYVYQWSTGSTSTTIDHLVKGSYTVTVIDQNGCNHFNTAIITEPPPIVIGTVTGTKITGCLTSVSSSSPYSITAVANASYHWTAPSGMTITAGQSTNAITGSWTGTAINANGISGQLCVEVNTGCGIQTSCAAIDLNVVAPVTPGSVSGPDKACPGDIGIYSVAGVNRATYYVWTLPPGVTPIGASNSNIITVLYPAGFVSGIITVASKNACGTSSTRSRFVSTNILPAPTGISGQVFTGLCGVTGASYSITNPITGANSYSWTVPSGATITSNTGSGITVNFATNFSGGLITVVAINNCGPGTTRSASVIGAPGFPTIISGPLSVCSGTNAVYSIPTISGTSTYTWTWTRGFSYFSGQGTKTLTLKAATVPAANQTITVKASNACGISNARVLDLIQIVSCPRIGSSEYETNLNVYPNPANEILNITFNSEKDQDCELKMLDATERVVIKNSLKSKFGSNHYELNVRDLSAGIYLLQIQVGEVQKQLKVIIE